MAYLLSPLYNDAQFDSAGDPLVGGKLYWYQAGTTTLATVYTDATGATSHANPIVLDSRGEPGSPIYLDDAVSYKSVLKDSADVTIRTIDGIDGIAEPTGAITEWTAFSGAPTYVDADEFSVAGDQTATFHVGRRVRLTLSGSTLYGTIAATTYVSATTVRVTLDSGSLDGTLTAVAYGLSYANTPVPTLDAATTVSGTWTPTISNTGNIGSSTARVCKYQRIGGIVAVSGSISLTPTSDALSVSFRLSLPIASSFSTGFEAMGTVTVFANDTVYGSGNLTGWTDGTMLIQVPSAGSGTQAVYFSGMYEIV